jgi:hypothetical protein
MALKLFCLLVHLVGLITAGVLASLKKAPGHCVPGALIRCGLPWSPPFTKQQAATPPHGR